MHLALQLPMSSLDAWFLVVAAIMASVVLARLLTKGKFSIDVKGGKIVAVAALTMIVVAGGASLMKMVVPTLLDSVYVLVGVYAVVVSVSLLLAMRAKRKLALNNSPYNTGTATPSPSANSAFTARFQ